ncbi:hypothetical protein Kpho02_45920 [Kitasatospora phosalacinea]|uniref:Uncharacterized protein n=1 Tax=Kitasatospora phosalacinea TaxID=2065 RepID=A0A9W6QCB4_9ACTN|nr:hypothetical protein Kpho02_45920 [Kitasatospora phosalacinea]
MTGSATDRGVAHDVTDGVARRRDDARQREDDTRQKAVRHFAARQRGRAGPFGTPRRSAILPADPGATPTTRHFARR